MINNPIKIVREIAGFIGLQVSKKDIESIVEMFSKERVLKYIKDLEKITVTGNGKLSNAENSNDYAVVRNRDGSVRIFDHDTSFQTSHITSKKEGE